MPEMMTIGEFATATWLSPKALRLYDKIGLLSPSLIDPHNGYRKYSHAQIESARLITMLRRIEMPLNQIGELLALPDAERPEFVARFWQAESEKHARKQSLSRLLERAVAGGTVTTDEVPIPTGIEVSRRSVTDSPVLTSTHYTTARALPEVIRKAADSLLQLAHERGGATGDLTVIYHGQVGWESDGPVEVCVPIKNDARAHRIELGHDQLFTAVPPEDVQFPGILAAFDAVQIHASRLGFNVVGPPRECYTLSDFVPTPRCDVALPVLATCGRA